MEAARRSPQAGCVLPGPAKPRRRPRRLSLTAGMAPTTRFSTMPETVGHHPPESSTTHRCPRCSRNAAYEGRADRGHHQLRRLRQHRRGPAGEAGLPRRGLARTQVRLKSGQVSISPIPWISARAAAAYLDIFDLLLSAMQWTATCRAPGCSRLSSTAFTNFEDVQHYRKAGAIYTPTPSQTIAIAPSIAFPSSGRPGRPCGPCPFPGRTASPTDETEVACGRAARQPRGPQ